MGENQKIIDTFELIRSVENCKSWISQELNISRDDLCYNFKVVNVVGQSGKFNKQGTPLSPTQNVTLSSK